MGYKIHSMDVNNTFLLDKDIYLSQAEGLKSKEHPPFSLIRTSTFLKLKVSRARSIQTTSASSSMPSTVSSKHLWPGIALSNSTSWTWASNIHLLIHVSTTTMSQASTTRPLRMRFTVRFASTQQITLSSSLSTLMT